MRKQHAHLSPRPQSPYAQPVFSRASSVAQAESQGHSRADKAGAGAPRPAWSATQSQSRGASPPRAQTVRYAANDPLVAERRRAQELRYMLQELEAEAEAIREDATLRASASSPRRMARPKTATARTESAGGAAGRVASQVHSNAELRPGTRKPRPRSAVVPKSVSATPARGAGAGAGVDADPAASGRTRLSRGAGASAEGNGMHMVAPGAVSVVRGPKDGTYVVREEGQDVGRRAPFVEQGYGRRQVAPAP